jgi:hypothetical protein
MMKTVPHQFIRLMIAGSLALCSTLFKAETQSEYFPLTKGNYWIYKGETKYLVPKKEAPPNSGQNEAKSEILTWKMEVVDTTEGGNYHAALIKGMPMDLAWYTPGKD